MKFTTKETYAIQAKYIVGRNKKTGGLSIGHNIQGGKTFEFHSDIFGLFDPIMKPLSAGWFSVEVKDGEYDLDSVKTFGRSDGYGIVPRLLDDVKIKQLLKSDYRVLDLDPN